jgi:hypothetical protein
MVDVVVNNVMATSTNPDLSNYFFKDKVGSTAGEVLWELTVKINSHSIIRIVQ